MGIYERFFNDIASQLDLTSTEEETIIKSYESVGEFLRNSNFLSAYLPYVFPQENRNTNHVCRVRPHARVGLDHYVLPVADKQT